MGHSASRWAAKAIVGSLLLTLWIGLADGSAQTSPPASVQPQDGYPVAIDGREILRIYDGVGSFTARDRAEAVGDRLQKLAKDPRVDVNNIKVADSPFGSSIELGDNV